MSLAPLITLSNGNKIPVLGLGTWRGNAGDVFRAVKDAIDIGYRHFDCALVYENESEVGAALKAKIDEGVVKREDLFITSKLWNTYHETKSVLTGIKKSLKNLGLDYLDLYLIHWPMASKEGDELFPKNPDGTTIMTDTDYLDTWKGMEQIYQLGLAKNIGISNFNSEQITRLLEHAKIKPVVNQVECHPYLNQKKLSEFCKARDIVITAYSPLGSPDRPWVKPGDPVLLDDVKLVKIAEKYGKSPAQVVIRYQIDRGHVVIPKTVTPTRLVENFGVLDFNLTPEDIAYIDSFDVGGRLVAVADRASCRFYPFNIPY
ncbi:hypothetical protein PV328_001628 [Microctonus aethiopoides]|uniref:NADP-dependent oxidoreductase domain-containing protein n=1 Tax=Microctonus aethiopoides TaxID=144406 RepID=A0AA39FY15_9HYME|nr:hypothetical protein PV328_001628 [Microctonus aethiopoides]